MYNVIVWPLGEVWKAATVLRTADFSQADEVRRNWSKTEDAEGPLPPSMRWGAVLDEEPK